MSLTISPSGCVDVIVLALVSEDVDDAEAGQEIEETIEVGYTLELSDIQRSGARPELRLESCLTGLATFMSRFSIAQTYVCQRE